ncbi:hypothetical protein [Leptolyngbya sp. ST-U4]
MNRPFENVLPLRLDRPQPASIDSPTGLIVELHTKQVSLSVYSVNKS